jgi:hypothetical protein
MNMEYYWNNNELGRMKYSDKNMSQCHLVHQKSYMEWPRIKPGPLQ